MNDYEIGTPEKPKAWRSFPIIKTQGWQKLMRDCSGTFYMSDGINQVGMK
jgi:hypothetical protein